MRVLKKDILLFFTKKFSSVIYTEGGYALSRKQNDKTSYIWKLIPDTTTFSLKPVVEWVTAITFSHQNDAGSRSPTTTYWENLVLVVALDLESKAL